MKNDIKEVLLTEEQIQSKVKELAKQIEARRAAIPNNYDCEERGDNFWTMYQDGFAAAAYSKLEIVPTTLNLERSA